MAVTKPKLYVSRSRMVRVGTAVFIMLSVSLWDGVEGRRCYWCGPLAEQVHRSRRAPPCDAPAQLDHLTTTTCEPGLPHCAVVATTPPYIESRLCVKIYQDECYPLFCNSTKTWKMTCPCQGDLCNGYTTERENEAFAYLNKLVKKSSRIKRDGISPSTFIHPKEEKQTNDDDNSVVIELELTTNEALPTINNDSIENKEILAESIDQQPYGTTQATADATNDVEMEIPDSQIGLNDAVTQISAQSHVDDKEDSVNDILDMNMQADAPVKDENENIVQSTTLPSPPSTTDYTGTKSDATNAREMFKNVVATEATKLEAIIDQSTELSVKPSGELPTAEALSQNERDDSQPKLDPSVTTNKSPQEKVGLAGKTSVATTTELYTSPPVGAIEVTTKPSKSYAVKIYIHFYNYISLITLYFFI